jgi:PEP-CTERM motif
MGQHSDRKSDSRNTEFRRFCRRLLRALFVVAAVTVLLSVVWKWRRPQAAPTTPAPAVASSASNTPQLLAASAALEPHRLFPYSVIPGGARSAAELKNALMNDPIAAAHYAGFDLSRTHVIHLRQGRSVYVSYRIGDHIYWMSRKLWLPAGEAVLADGEHEARTRCGNRISETPQLPVALVEPSRAMLDTPVAPELAVTGEAPFLPFSAVQPGPPLWLGGADAVGGQIFVPPLVPIWGGSGMPGGKTPPGGPPVVPVTATPEPASLLLLSTGLLGLWACPRKSQP